MQDGGKTLSKGQQRWALFMQRGHQFLEPLTWKVWGGQIVNAIQNGIEPGAVEL